VSGAEADAEAGAEPGARRDLEGLALSSPRVVHIVALGGGAMSALATVLTRMGHRVSGSDVRDSHTLERIRLLGVDVRVGHDAANVPPDADMVIASTAIGADNSEVLGNITVNYSQCSLEHAMRGSAQVVQAKQRAWTEIY